MGDVPSDKVSSSGGAEGTTLAPEPNATKSLSSSGYMGPGIYENSSAMMMNHMAYSLPTHQSQPSPP
ncbi:hypothetical protein N7454_003059 [Penicillium verhagenii]|nr:hypothetical protein N7454_003059 [Penicillium verhagenii]